MESHKPLFICIPIYTVVQGYVLSGLHCTFSTDKHALRTFENGAELSVVSSTFHKTIGTN